MRQVGCGIDIGGSGVKGALVDLGTGEFIGERVRIPTPMPATPEAVAGVCREIIDALEVEPGTPVGVSFPAPIIHGTVPFMANLDQSWVGVNVDVLMTKTLDRPCHTLNDADAAGLAEVAFGAAKGVSGTVIVTTLGTGIGSAVIVDGTLVPNVELGHLEIDGHDAEKRASSAQKELQDLSWKKWAKRLQRYYSHVECSSPQTCSLWAAASRRSMRSSCRCWTCAPRSCRRPCSTPPASSAPPTPPRACPEARHARTRADDVAHLRRRPSCAGAQARPSSLTLVVSSALLGSTRKVPSENWMTGMCFWPLISMAA